MECCLNDAFPCTKEHIRFFPRFDQGDICLKPYRSHDAGRFSDLQQFVPPDLFGTPVLDPRYLADMNHPFLVFDDPV